MRVVLVTVYDHYCLGARLLLSNLVARGHDAYLVNLKRFVTRKFHFSNPDEMAKLRAVMEDSGNLPVLEFHGDGDYMCPYPAPISPEEREIFFEEIRRLDPEIVGVSLTSAFLPVIRDLSRELRRRLPRVAIVWGGIHTILLPEDGVGYADVICTGEADECFPEWLEDPARTDVPGFWFCRDGNVIRNPRAPLPQDLDRFPWPSYGDHTREFMIEDGGLRFYSPQSYGEYFFMTQRGCPFKCTYCLHAKTRDLFPGGKYIRRRSVDNVLDEVAAARERFGFEAVVFADDVFMIGRRWVSEFCEKYRARFPGFPFGAYGHYQFTDRDMLEDLERAGCLFTGIGLQSGSPYINEEVYRRKNPAEDVLRFVEAVREAGIRYVVYDLLTNSRFEREEDCLATLELLCRLPKPDKLSVKKIQPYPGSAYAELDLPDGGLAEADFHFYNLLYLLAAQPGMTWDFMRRLAGDANLRRDPEPLEKMVGLISRTRDELQEVREELRRARADSEAARGAMPWGVRRSARHFAEQVSRKLVDRV